MEKQLIQPMNRVGWIDVYKGVMIILVVIGHATGTFNPWIYQFHMAAFFFISGYLSDIERKNDIKHLCKKLFTVLFPYFSISIISFCINDILSSIGKYEALFGTSFIGVLPSVKAMLAHGDIYSQYLGTFWFLSALFGIELIHTIIIRLNDKRINCVYAFVSVVLYVIGFYFALVNVKLQIGIFNFTIILITQLYYFVGAFVKKCNIEHDYLNGRKAANIICILVAIIISTWGIMNGIVMDLASLSVKHPVSEFIVALSSIAIVICISKFIDKKKILASLFSTIGKNSLGIMIFHFTIFKLCFIYFYSQGSLTAEELTSVVLPGGSSIKLWLPMSIVAIGGSLLIWMLLKKIPIINFLVGQNNNWNNKFSERIQQITQVKKLDEEITSAIRNRQETISKFIKKYKAFVICSLVFTCLVCIPFFRTGVIVNDELQARCLSIQGFVNFYKTNFESYLRDGRPLAAIVNSITMYVGFIGKGNVIIFKSFQVIVLLLECVSFGIFTNKIVKNRATGILASILSFGLLPIVFEHMAPNAFVSLLGIPFLFLIISLNLYIDSINNDNSNKLLLLSMVLFFIAQMSYETFITYTLLYLIIGIGIIGVQNVKSKIKYFVAPIGSAFFYLVTYVLCSHIFTSAYAGNQIGFESFSSSLKIIGWLFIVCIPGFFIVFPRYQYLKEVFYNMELYDYILLTIIVVSFLVICIKLLRNINIGDKETKHKSIYIVICALLYMILPSLPISVSAMYQGNVGISGFLTLPITHYESFAAIFILAYLVGTVSRCIGKKFYVVLSLVLVILICNVQQMNIIFSKEQGKNYNRLIEIEDFLETDTFRSIDNSIYYSPDLYMQQNTLAIHDGYWTTYCYNNLGLQIQLLKESSDNENGCIFYDGDNFVIVNNESIIVVSKDQEFNSKAVEISEDEYVLFEFTDANIDGEYYVYKSINNEQSFNSVGYKLIDGGYSDGWLAKNSTFEVNTGDTGKVKISLFYPEDIKNYYQVSVLLNGEEYAEYDLTENDLNIQLPLESNEKYKIQLDCNFEVINKGNDLRELALVLSDISVE